MDCFPEIKFACQECKRGCCTLFEAAVSPEEKERISRLSLPGVPPPDRWFEPRAAGDFKMAKNPDTGRCFLVDSDNRCLIHKHYGYSHKPLSCRVFPLDIQHWADGHVSAEYRFICPGVEDCRGARIGDMDSAAFGLLADEMHSRRSAADTVFSWKNPAPLPAVRAFHAALSNLLHDEKMPRKLRLYTAARILHFHGLKSMSQAVKEADETFAEDAAAFVVKARSALEKELSDGVVNALTVTNFRNVICGFLRDDDPKVRHGFWFRMEKAYAQLRLTGGSALMSELNPAAPAVPGKFLPWRGNYHSLSPEGEEVFKAFFFGKLDSMHFCGRAVHNYSYEEGMRLLLVSGCAAFALANAFAMEEGAEELRRTDMLRAVRLLDFTFARSPFFRMRGAKKWLKELSDPAAYAGILNECVRC